MLKKNTELIFIIRRLNTKIIRMDLESAVSMFEKELSKDPLIAA